MIGPGRYDDICTQAREAAQADGVILVVIRGKHGMGFSAQVTNSQWFKHLPTILRGVADQMEKDYGEAQK
jgi:hypothetical protein